uniref:Uncharacterized protein n=1 Tax=Arundo donax TaxID=35708 RepID=A0A0A8Z4U7_ARUDO
MEGLGQPAS